MLNEHPSIAIPHPPHILKEMVPLEARYGDLRDDRNFRRLVDDTVRLVELHFSPWDVAISREAVFRESPARDVYGVKAAVYDLYRRAKNKRRWGCKSTFVIHYVDRVRRVHPEAKFIHLVRDGRDVAVSARRSVFNHFHPHYVGRLWAREQRLAIELAGRLSPSDMISVRYEDLLDDPAGVLQRLCDFVREDYSEAMLKYHEGGEAKNLANQSRSWENCAKPVLTGNRSKYRSQLSEADVRAFERQAFEELRHYGYELANDYDALRSAKAKGLGFFVRLRYWMAERALSAREALRSLIHDQNALIRIRKMLFVLKLRIV